MNADQARLARTLWPDAGDRPPPRRVIACRHCRKNNRVPVPEAVLDPDSCECGCCGKPLFLAAGEPLSGLTAAAYQHSLDRKSLEALKSLPGTAAATRWIATSFAERGLRIYLMSSAVRCGEGQFPELLELVETARTRLGISTAPELFLSESPFMNAGINGGERPCLVVASALLDQLTDREVVPVLGHELGHMQAEHGPYGLMAQLLALGGSLIPGVSRLLAFSVRKAIAKWSRCAELTADRAGLLASRDLGASLSVILKLAAGARPGTTRRTELRLEPFVQQARDLAKMESDSALDSAFAVWMTLDATHPFAAWRVMHLLSWVDSGSYLDILAGNYPRGSRTAAA